MTLDIRVDSNDIRSMSKVTRIKRTMTSKRSAKGSQFIGRTAEGLLIPRPEFKPVNFTVQQLQEAIRSVRRENEAAAEAG